MMQIRTQRDPLRQAGLAAAGLGGGAAARHHPLLLQDRVHRGRRRHQGADRMRRDQLRGGEMAWARGAVLLRAHGGERPREPKFLQFISRGFRSGMRPCNDNDVYWFFN